MLEKREEFTLSIQMTKSTKKLSWMREENWKDLWLQPCRAKDKKSITKVVAKSNSASEENSKKMHSWKVESHESTRQRAESSQSKKHEDHIAGNEFTLMTRYNLAHKFIPMPQAMKMPDAKAAVDGQGGAVTKACPQ